MNVRRMHVLDLVAEGHIRSAQPVPSGWVAQQLDVSSATVRNDFTALEDAGLLMQPHASAGRVPTARGYDRYARKFIPPRGLPDVHRRLLVERLAGAHGESLLQRIAAAAAELSGYAVVVSLPADDAVTAVEIHLSALAGNRLLAVVVLENGLLRQVTLELEPVPSDDILRDAESSLRQLTLPVARVPGALEDIARRVDEELGRTLRALAGAWSGMNPPRFFSGGLRNLLREPESADPSFVRSVLERVEGPSDDALEPAEGLRIVLDSSLAVVSARLEMGGLLGGLTLLGPMRMRYPEALMVAHGVTQTVSHVAAGSAELN